MPLRTLSRHDLISLASSAEREKAVKKISAEVTATMPRLLEKLEANKTTIPEALKSRMMELHSLGWNTADFTAYGCCQN